MRWEQMKRLSGSDKKEDRLAEFLFITSSPSRRLTEYLVIHTERLERKSLLKVTPRGETRPKWCSCASVAPGWHRNQAGCNIWERGKVGWELQSVSMLPAHSGASCEPAAGGNVRINGRSVSVLVVKIQKCSSCSMCLKQVECIGKKNQTNS